MIGDPIRARKFVITDIHGCAKTFKAILEKVKFSDKDSLYILGDMINKGPRSKQVLDHIMRLYASQSVVILRGNHEQVFLDQLERKKLSKRFKQIDGMATLKSFGVKHVKEIPGRYLKFIKKTTLSEVQGRYIMVHAGLDFSQKDPLSANTKQYKIRNWYKNIDYEWLGDRIILHGHSPITKHRVKFQAAHIEINKYLDLDAGCVYTDKKGKGRLAIFEMDTQSITFQKNIDL